MKKIFDPGTPALAGSSALLILRAGTGLMLALGHGWGKLVTFGTGAVTFPDPLGIGHTASMACTIGAEFFCSLLVVAGLGTRLAALAVAFTMSVVAFVVLAGTPWGKRELALAYLVPFLALAFAGAGRFSLDAWITRRKKR
jgi:putative oxidoreductase